MVLLHKVRTSVNLLNILKEQIRSAIQKTPARLHHQMIIKIPKKMHKNGIPFVQIGYSLCNIIICARMHLHIKF